MALKRLTDIGSATGVTLSDFIHIVITGDTSQDPAGSSYKASLQQVYDVFNISNSVFTGNTSATCITDLYVSNLYGCSPITIYDSIQSNGTQAIGSYSHAEGINTITLGDYSHAEGETTSTGTQTAFSADSVTNGLVILNPSYGDATPFFSTNNRLYLYDYPPAGPGTYGNLISTISGVTFNGTFTEIQLYDVGISTTSAYVGDLNFLQTNNTFNGDKTIPGNRSHSEGTSTMTIGDYSHAEGVNTQAVGNSSHAEGYYTQTTGLYSHSEGSNTQAIGPHSHAEGEGTQAVGNSSHAEGSNTQAIGDYSHAEGTNTFTGIKTAFSADSVTNGLVILNPSYGDATSFFTVDGRLYLYDYSPVGPSNYGTITPTISGVTFNGTFTEIQLYDVGISTTSAYVGDTAYLQSNLEFGGDKTIPGNRSHSEGQGAKAIGYDSHAEGYNTQTLNLYSHAEGVSTQTLGIYSHSEGSSTQAIGDSSHAEGSDTKAIGDSSHAEGSITQAIGDSSHAEGYNTQALGDSSHAEGLYTIAVGPYQHVTGQYNLTASTQSAFIIGNGIDASNRSNLLFAAGNEVGIGTSSPSEKLDVVGNVNITGQIYIDIPPTHIPSGTSQTINWDDGNYQIIDLDSATGNVTLTFTNAKAGAVYSLQVIQGSVTRSLVYPGSIKWEGGTPLVPTSGNDAIDLITMVYNGTDFLASYGSAYS